MDLASKNNFINCHINAKRKIIESGFSEALSEFDGVSEKNQNCPRNHSSSSFIHVSKSFLENINISSLHHISAHISAWSSMIQDTWGSHKEKDHLKLLFEQRDSYLFFFKSFGEYEYTSKVSMEIIFEFHLVDVSLTLDNQNLNISFDIKNDDYKDYMPGDGLLLSAVDAEDFSALLLAFGDYKNGVDKTLWDDINITSEIPLSLDSAISNVTKDFFAENAGESLVTGCSNGSIKLTRIGDQLEVTLIDDQYRERRENFEDYSIRVSGTTGMNLSGYFSGFSLAMDNAKDPEVTHRLASKNSMRYFNLDYSRIWNYEMSLIPNNPSLSSVFFKLDPNDEKSLYIGNKHRQSTDVGGISGVSIVIDADQASLIAGMLTGHALSRWGKDK